MMLADSQLRLTLVSRSHKGALGEEYPVRIPADWPESVVYLCQKQFDGGREKYTPVATAFLVSVPREKADLPSYHYIVTAKHVVDAFQHREPIIVRINTQDGGCAFIESTKDKWFVHSTRDVAVAMLAPLLSGGEKLQYRTLPCPRYFVQRDLSFSSEFSMSETPTGIPIAPTTLAESVQLGDELCFIGLFSRHAGDNRNLPITRFGNVSRLPSEPIKLTLRPGFGHEFVYEAPVILAECRSWGGHSGSPVFWEYTKWVMVHQTHGKAVQAAMMHGPFRAFLGLVSAHFDVMQKAQSQYEELFHVPVNAGVAVITPAWDIEDLLMRDDAKDERKRHADENHDSSIVVTADGSSPDAMIPS